MEGEYICLNSKDIFAIIATLVLVFGLFVIDPYMFDKNARTIKRELKKRGYDVEGIGFFRNEQYEELVYQSTCPIFYKGNNISLWLLKINYHPSIFIKYYSYSVKPYTPTEE